MLEPSSISEPPGAAAAAAVGRAMEPRARCRVAVEGAALPQGKELVALQYHFKPQALDSSKSSDVKAKITSRGSGGDITLLLDSETFRGSISSQGGPSGAGLVDCILEIDRTGSGAVAGARLARVAQVVSNLKQDQSDKRKRVHVEPVKKVAKLIVHKKSKK